MRLLRLLLLTGTVLPGFIALHTADAAPGRMLLAQGGPEERGPRGGEPPHGGPRPERPPQERPGPPPGPPQGRERPEPRPERAAPPPRERPEPPAPRQSEPPQRDRAPERRPEPPAARPPAQERPDRQEQGVDRREQRQDRQEQRQPDARPERPERRQDRQPERQPERPAPDRDDGPNAQPRPSNERPPASPQPRPTPDRDRRGPDADRPTAPQNAPARPNQPLDNRSQPGAGPSGGPGRPAPSDTGPGEPGRPGQRQNLQRQDLERQDVQPGERPQPNAGPGAEPNRPVPPNMAPGVPGRPVQRQDVQPDGRPQPNAGPGAEPGRPLPPNRAPGVIGRPVQPPGQTDAPVGAAGNGALNAPGQPGYVPGGFRQDDDVRDYAQVRRDRREYSEGGRTFYREPGRIIVRDRDGYLIRHDENERFRDLDPRGYRSERRGGDYYSFIDRPGGEQIVTVTDDDGRMLRRYRRYRDGREVILIDNSYAGPPRPIYEDVVVLPPPDIRIPRDRYVVEYDQADEGAVYEALTAPPVAAIDRRYTLDQVRYSPDLRARMRSVDIDTITFETGSFTVTPDQAARLSVIAAAINRAIRANPQEVFLIEGYTDAVGSDIDNLSLSDRRAQSVATVLTQQFQVPPENLTTQGYGEQYLKVNTQGPSRENRRVTVRRITPLLQQGQAQGTPPR